MGGHGGSSGYTKVKKASKEISDLKDALHGGLISLGEYSKAKHDVVDKYGLSKDEAKLALGMTNMTSEADKKKAYDEANDKKKPDPAEVLKTVQQAQANYLAKKDLPGQAGNPWPPDAGKNHLKYEGGGGLGVWNQFGGGAKNGGVSSAKAKELYKAVDDFTGNHYDQIRDAMKAGDTTSQWGKQGAKCEEFISAGIKAGQGWNGGATYRGVGGLSNAALTAIHNMKAGDPIDCNWGGCASWSTKRSVSEGFGSGYNHVTFVHLGSKQKGVSVTNIAHYGTGEQEVLVSKDAKFKVAAVVAGKVGTYSQTYVYVEDAD